MTPETEIIGVRQLVELILRQGSIESGVEGGIRSMKRALEGGRLHRKIQKGQRGDYAAEVDMRKTVPLVMEDGTVFEHLTVEGRADGIYTSTGDGLSMSGDSQQLSLDALVLPQEEAKPVRAVDEIKSVSSSLEYITNDTYPLHFAQAECYAYFLAEEENLEEVLVRLTYIQTETEEIKYLYRLYHRRELKAFFDHLITSYTEWARRRYLWKKERTASLEPMPFPYDTYRDGQKQMASYVYQAVKAHSHVFLQAPTGIGKTVSSLFPALKAMGQGHTEKIFYLTAKNTTAEAALSADERMRKKSGMRLKTIHLTAKDKLCPLVQKGLKRRCDPQHCAFANGHYDRINQAVLESIRSQDRFEASDILRLCEKYRVCPYEFSLDLSMECDLIVCDDNYVFDPTVSLRRYFSGGKQNFTLLVDEAHNLVDRARNMFSAKLSRQQMVSAKKRVPEKSRVGAALDKVSRLFQKAKKEHPAQEGGLEGSLYAGAAAFTPGEDWLQALSTLADRMDEYFLMIHRSGRDARDEEELYELYFDVLFFIRTLQTMGDGYESYLTCPGRNVEVHLFCVDPSEPLKEVYEKVGGVVFFSATLTPLSYYQNLLGGADDPAFRLPSPFDPDHLRVMTAPLPVTYQNRRRTLEPLCELIYETICAKEGHYMAFFPSFAYMDVLCDAFCAKHPDVKVVRQKSGMSQEERDAFMRSFSDNTEAVLGFCVLGGVFSEGIDLVGEKLIGVMIVTVGLPQICLERDLIRQHIDRESDHGFEYAYVYPGLNRVLQAAGRVIRTDHDAGVVLLVDQRFEQDRYQRLYPDEWERIRSVDTESLPGVLEEFWRRIEIR